MSGSSTPKQQLEIYVNGAQSRKRYNIDGSYCFGLLRNIPTLVNPNRQGQPITLEEVGRYNEIFASLELDIADDRCDILAKGIPIARMNTKTHFALKSLRNKEHLKYIGLIPRSELQQKLAADAKSLSCLMGIVIFGPRFVADNLARDLSRYHLFLQHPDYIPAGVHYYNPQYLDIAGSSFVNGSILPPISTEVLENNTEQLDDNAAPDLETVIDNLPRPAHLREANVDQRICTTLLSHQREAIDFITRRESAEIHHTNPRSLWHQESLGSELAVYKHIITGSTSPRPEDILGGILADDMGLGKTLAIISSIVASLPHVKKSPNEQANTSLTLTDSTLIIVPSLLLIDGWVGEIEKHVVPGTLTYYKYHGETRHLSRLKTLPDVVLSTYGTVASDFSHGRGILSYFHWRRIILDEAHVVRNSSSKRFKAVASLKASIRWCVTGTPVQNSLNDLASLIKFLRVPLLEDTKTFRRYIAKVAANAKKPDYGNLKLLLGQICLRRSISTISTSLGATFVEHRPSFSAKERKDYEMLSNSCSHSIGVFLDSRSTKGLSEAVLTAVLRLRIFCNTGMTDIGDNFMPDETMSLLQQGGETPCTECGSDILSSGAGDAIGGQKGPRSHFEKCQRCAPSGIGLEDAENISKDSQVLASLNVDNSILHIRTNLVHRPMSTHDAPKPSLYPSKITALLADIKRHYSTDKSIVFSIWRRSLDLVGDIFQSESIAFGRIDGSMSTAQRKNVLDQFCNSHTMSVLLMTIGTGSVGLNGLSVASRVHILEPQWNPSVEKQAIGRVFRLAQSKPVHIIRYIMKDTVEETIESRQMSKV